MTETVDNETYITTLLYFDIHEYELRIRVTTCVTDSKFLSSPAMANFWEIRFASLRDQCHPAGVFLCHAANDSKIFFVVLFEYFEPFFRQGNDQPARSLRAEDQIDKI